MTAVRVFVVGHDPVVRRRVVDALVGYALAAERAGRPAPWPRGPDGVAVDTVSARDRQEPTLMDLDGVAAALSISKRTVERLVARGELPAVRIERSVRVRRDDLAAYVEQLT